MHMDTFSRKVRSAIMSSVKSRGNKTTEWPLRSRFVQAGVKGWRMHPKGLPSVPDFCFPHKKMAIFVDGCFWHGCRKCYRRPKTSCGYWDKKVFTNIRRDRLKRAGLQRMGWIVIRFWEHEVKKSPQNCVEKIFKLSCRSFLRKTL